MRARLRLSTALAVGALIGAHTAPVALAHDPVTPSTETWTASERLLISDSATGDIHVVDDGRHVARVSTPKAPISLARTTDGSTAVAIRGRDTDRITATFIDTGFDEKTGHARIPFVARTWVGKAPGGVHNGHLPEFDGNVGIVDERTGILTYFSPAALQGFGTASVRTITLRGADHYSFAPARTAAGAPVLHVGHLRKGRIDAVDPRTGAHLRSTTGCPAVHGSTPDATAKRIVFACRDGLLTVPADPASPAKPQRTPYPTKSRVGNLVSGHAGIRWGYSEGAPGALHRVDTAGRSVTISMLPLATGSARHATRISATPDGSRLLVLTAEGYLQIRDGGSGHLIKEVRTGPRTPRSASETTAVASSPDIAATASTAYVSVPTKGQVLEVSLEDGSIGDRLDVGGTPTRLSLLHAEKVVPLTGDGDGHPHEHGHGKGHGKGHETGHAQGREHGPHRHGGDHAAPSPGRPTP